jgi:hypothetical protein
MILIDPQGPKKRAGFSGPFFLMALLFIFMTIPIGESLIGLDNTPNQAYAAQGDQDGDGDVDLGDVEIFIKEELKKKPGRRGKELKRVRQKLKRLKSRKSNDNETDWCQWLQDYLKDNKWDELYDFLWDYFECDQPPCPEDYLAVVHTDEHLPVRLALGPSGSKLYVSDAQFGSVFIYEVLSGGLNLIGEIKGLYDPLGIAVDSEGRIYVGSDGNDNVEVYDSAGCKVDTIGIDTVRMPNDLAFDREGNLYVVDSESNRVWVFNPDGYLLRTIGRKGDGNGRFRFPVSLTISYRVDLSGQEVGEVFVADQGHGLVQVFDLQGNFLRAFGGKPSSGMMGYETKGKFARLQSLQVDGFDRLHGLDSHMSQIQILNPDSGAHIAFYSSRGSDPGQLALPLDMVIAVVGDVEKMVVANYGNKRIEILSIP